MKKYTLLFLYCFFTLLLTAQDRPAFFPEDIDSKTLQLKCLCKPGVVNKSRSRGLEFSFIHTSSSKLEEEEGFPLSEPASRLTLQNFNLKLRAPIINREGFKIIAGVFYRPEHYDFQEIGPDYNTLFNYLDGRTLKSTGFEGLVVKSLNEKIYTSLRVRNFYNGDYAGVIDFDNRFSILNISGVVGFKQDDYKEWGVGINFSSGFRRTLVLPFFLYNQTFNEKWGIEMVLPALASVRYNISENSILLFGARYNSRSYSVGSDDNIAQIYNLNHSEIRTGFTLEQKLHPWIWLDLGLGFQYNFSTDFEALDNEVATFEVEPSSRPVFRIGVFVSPPSSFLK